MDIPTAKEWSCATVVEKRQRSRQGFDQKLL
jgi:hypothetical protein